MRPSALEVCEIQRRWQSHEFNVRGLEYQSWLPISELLKKHTLVPKSLCEAAENFVKRLALQYGSYSTGELNQSFLLFRGGLLRSAYLGKVPHSRHIIKSKTELATLVRAELSAGSLPTDEGRFAESVVHSLASKPDLDIRFPHYVRISKEMLEGIVQNLYILDRGRTCDYCVAEVTLPKRDPNEPQRAKFLIRISLKDDPREFFDIDISPEPNEQQLQNDARLGDPSTLEDRSILGTIAVRNGVWGIFISDNHPYLPLGKILRPVLTPSTLLRKLENALLWPTRLSQGDIWRAATNTSAFVSEYDVVANARALLLLAHFDVSLFLELAAEGVLDTLRIATYVNHEQFSGMKDCVRAGVKKYFTFHKYRREIWPGNSKNLKQNASGLSQLLTMLAEQGVLVSQSPLIELLALMRPSNCESIPYTHQHPSPDTSDSVYTTTNDERLTWFVSTL